jgi:hypothetical protein
MAWRRTGPEFDADFEAAQRKSRLKARAEER